MPRFFIDPLSSAADGSFIGPEGGDGQYIFIGGDDARHITRSLRMREGERLVVCDGAGFDYECECASLSDGEVTARVLEKKPSSSEPSVCVTLYQGYPKGDKLEFIIEKATELGAAGIVPVMTERSVARPDERSVGKKLLRWQRHALEAAKQSGRGRIPSVSALTDFSELGVLLKKHDLVIFCYELGGEPLGEIIGRFAAENTLPGASIGLFIGAEGGISEAECERLREWGALPATLGRRILRCETAPLATLTAVMLLSGNMD